MVADREIDVLVAEKVMGWKRWMNGNRVIYFLAPEATACGYIKQSIDFGELLPHDGRGDEDNAPHYSTDIAAAWLVVEKIAPRLCFQVDAVGHRPNIWRCVIGWGDDPVAVMAEAATAPHAICLAALAAVGARK